MSTWSSIKEELGQAIKDVAMSSSSPEVQDDLQVLQRLVLHRREPRIALVGSAGVPLHDVLAAIGATSPVDDVRAKLGLGRWYEHEFDAGLLSIADLRGETGLRALEYHAPDAVIAVAQSGSEDVAGVVDALVVAIDTAEDLHATYPVGLVVVFRTDGQRHTADFRSLQAFKAEFSGRDLPRDWVDVECVSRLQQAEQTLATPLVRQLPMEVRFSLARLSDDTTAKRAVAFDIVRLASTLNAAIASVPIPVASALPITTIQIAMIAGIASLAGRPAGVQSVSEFAAAIGINLGAAVAFREIARALISWVPIAGPAISASIAAGATLTLGKAATTHYLGSPR